MEPVTETTPENLLVEHYIKFLIALVEHGNMPASTWEEEPHLLRLVSGVEDEEFNAIFSMEEPMRDPVKIKQQIARMSSFGLPFTWVLPDHDNFRYMESLLVEQGMNKQLPSQGLIGAPKIQEIPQNEVRVMAVTNEPQIDLWLDIYQKSFFDGPLPLLKQLFYKVLMDPESPFKADVAFLNNEPAGCNLMFYSHGGQVAGFWCTGVLPEVRGKGIAKALIHKSMEKLSFEKVPYAAVWLDQNGTLLPHFTRLELEPKIRLTCFT